MPHEEMAEVRKPEGFLIVVAAAALASVIVLPLVNMVLVKLGLVKA